MVEATAVNLITALVFLSIGYFFGVYKTQQNDAHYRDMKDLAHTYGNLSAQLINGIGHPVGYPEGYPQEEEPEEQLPEPELAGGVLDRG